jgi:hypothetical protein
MAALASPKAEQARTRALEELVPKSINVLQEHLASGRLDAWRQALRILEHAWGRPKETVEVHDEGAEHPAEGLGLAELEELRGRLLTEQTREQTTGRRSALMTP